MIEKILLVGAGGAVGAVLRFSVIQLAGKLTGETAWGTLFVNVVGSFLMGALAIYVLNRLGEGGAAFAAFALTGCLGAFTTFSAFSLDAFRLYEGGQSLAAGLYVVGSVILSLAGLLLGILFARALLS